MWEEGVIEYLADEEEGEKVQVCEIARKIEKMVEETKMELEQEPQDQNIDLVPRLSEVAP